MQINLESFLQLQEEFKGTLAGLKTYNNTKVRADRRYLIQDNMLLVMQNM